MIATKAEDVSSDGASGDIAGRSIASGRCIGKKTRPSEQRRLPDVLSDGQARALLGCVRTSVHKTCLTLVYACGLRISEAARLEVGAIDSVNHPLRIMGKGDKVRLVTLPSRRPP